MITQTLCVATVQVRNTALQPSPDNELIEISDHDDEAIESFTPPAACAAGGDEGNGDDGDVGGRTLPVPIPAHGGAWASITQTQPFHIIQACMQSQAHSQQVSADFLVQTSQRLCAALPSDYMSDGKIFFLDKYGV